MTSNAGHFYFIIITKDYFTSFAGVSAFDGVSAFASFEQQAFFPVEAHAFFSVAVHSVFAFVLSSFVDALTVETAKPIVKAIAKTIANFFMISIFYWLLLKTMAKLKIFS
jgi:hypothetical protein